MENTTIQIGNLANSTLLVQRMVEFITDFTCNLNFENNRKKRKDKKKPK